MRKILPAFMLLAFAGAAVAQLTFFPPIPGGNNLSNGGFSSIIVKPGVPPVDTSITNLQKLTLPAGTTVGTSKTISDAFYVTGFGDARDGFYFPLTSSTGLTNVGAFAKSFPLNGDTIYAYFDTTIWKIGSDNTSFVDSDTGGANPWNATWTTAALTLTHPAAQTLAAPSSAQGGVYVAGGDPLAIGVWIDRGFDGSSGKNFYSLLGHLADSGAAWSIHWDVGDSRWNIRVDNGENAVVYYSLSDVASPDLASNWKNASDDSPAGITVTNVTLGDLGKGVQSGGDTYQNQGGAWDGYPVYVNISVAGTYFVHFSSAWHKTDAVDNSGTNIEASSTNTVTPDLATWPTLTVTADHVANEANWTATP